MEIFAIVHGQGDESYIFTNWDKYEPNVNLWLPSFVPFNCRSQSRTAKVFFTKEAAEEELKDILDFYDDSLSKSFNMPKPADLRIA